MKKLAMIMAAVVFLACGAGTQAVEMVLIPSGEFEMGRHVGDGEEDELPVHSVYVDSFYMGKYEVTNQQYCDYLNLANSAGQIKVDAGIVYDSDDATNSQPYCDTTTSSSYSRIEWDGSSFSVVPTKEYHPMVVVSWYGAKAFCDYYGYRLPTEAEWEYAARGGEHNPYYRYPWGDTIDGSKANYINSGDPYESTEPKTTPVGYYDGNQIPSGVDMVNGYGLYDMIGNVYEWCNDWYSSTYYSTAPYPHVNPIGPAIGNFRIHRGGYWDGYDENCRVANRIINYPVDRGESFGFRVARNAEPAEPNIHVSPLSHDFGDVELGTSRTVIVTISNVGTGDLNVSGIALETDFAITSAPAAAIVVEPGATKDVEITYTPSAIGHNSAILKINSNDPDQPVVEVTLGAVGIEIPPPPSEQIANILTFFDASVEEGTLLGDGPGNSAEKRLNALRNMIEAAGDLIERELLEETCQQLLDVCRRMDGQPAPPDFVKGEAVPELMGMVQDLMTTLGCE